MIMLIQKIKDQQRAKDKKYKAKIQFEWFNENQITMT